MCSTCLCVENRQLLTDWGGEGRGGEGRGREGKGREGKGREGKGREGRGREGRRGEGRGGEGRGGGTCVCMRTLIFSLFSLVTSLSVLLHL